MTSDTILSICLDDCLKFSNVLRSNCFMMIRRISSGRCLMDVSSHTVFSISSRVTGPGLLFALSDLLRRPLEVDSGVVLPEV